MTDPKTLTINAERLGECVIRYGCYFHPFAITLVLDSMGLTTYGHMLLKRMAQSREEFDLQVGGGKNVRANLVGYPAGKIGEFTPITAEFEVVQDDN